MKNTVIAAAAFGALVLVAAQAVGNAPSAQSVANKPKDAQPASVVALQRPSSPPEIAPVATIHNWAEVGDRLVKEKRYKEAYSAYMVRCDSDEGSNSSRMAGCGAAYDLRMAAKANFVDTTYW